MDVIKISPFFSVVISTFNRPHLLPRSIKSILDQTYKDFEIVIINDGSNLDYTEVEEFIAKIENISYYITTNKGRSAARNLGINKARGKYICFLDDDDIYYSHHLQSLYKKIASTGSLKALYHTRAKRNIDGKVTLVEPGTYKKEGLSPVLDDMFTIHSVAIHQSILKELGFNTEFSYWEDIDLWIRIAIEYPIIKIENYTVEYIFHSDNTVGWKKENIEEKLKTILYFKEEYKQYIPKPFLTNLLFQLATALADFHIKDLHRSIRYLGIAGRAKPSSIFTRYYLSILVKSVLAKIKR